MMKIKVHCLTFAKPSVEGAEVLRTHNVISETELSQKELEALAEPDERLACSLVVEKVATVKKDDSEDIETDKEKIIEKSYELLDLKNRDGK